MDGKNETAGEASGAETSGATDSASSKPTASGTNVRLLELLVCPLTKSSLVYDKERQELVSRAARLAYPIRDGVPLMTVEAARNLDDETR